jgi:hypothetical protein
MNGNPSWRAYCNSLWQGFEFMELSERQKMKIFDSRIW